MGSFRILLALKAERQYVCGPTTPAMTPDGGRAASAHEQAHRQRRAVRAAIPARQ
jgi:hypothetical protein